MSLYPYMGAPQSVQGGLLGSPSYPMGAAQSYAYPLTSGLLGAISNAGGMHPFVQQATGLNPSVAAQQAQMSQTPQDYTQVALGLAGNPHAGPYSTAGNAVQPGPATNSAAGSTSGTSTGSQVLGGLLGALSKDPSLVKGAGNAISGLLGGSLGAYGSGAAANAAVASQLGNSAASDGTAQSVQNSNDAALKASDPSINGASAGLLSMDNLGSGMAANSAVTGELGGVGAQTAGESAAIQAANDAALSGSAASSGAGLLGGLGAYGSGAAADAAIASQLGNVANDGTAASVAAANDAALNATDGGAAGAGAGTGSGALGSATQALGALGSAYSLYNTIKNYQSGATGSDALNGAETGASIGTAILPGVGTIVGGLLGGAAGALSSAFGPGQEDPENAAWNQYAAQYNANPNIASTLTPEQAYQNLAGVMDAKDNSPGHSQPLEQVFGRMGEQNLMDQMTSYINQQEQAGKIKPGESVQDQWNQVINPWLQSKGAGINMNQNTAQGAPEGSALTNDLQTLVGQWENGLITPQNSVAGAGMVIGGLPGLYSGMTPQQLSALQQRINANAAHQQLIHSIGSTKKFNG